MKRIGRDKANVAEQQRRPRVTGYYQRSKAEDLSAKASDPVGKVKHSSTAREKGGPPHSQQQVEDADLREDWEMAKHEDLQKLQVENAAKDDTIIMLERKHEEENQILRREVEMLKRKVSLSRPLTRSYAREQKLQEMEGRYEQQYHEELQENTRLRGKISELEKEIEGQAEGSTHIDKVDDPDLNVELRRKEQHVYVLQTQVESLQQHSKSQSKHILLLRQELEAVKISGEEIDASWRDMVDQLEEENKKLLLEVGGLRQDKKLLEKSSDALKTRNQKLEPHAQKLEISERQEKEALQNEVQGAETEELVRSRMEVTRLTTDVEQLRREKADLQGEIEAHKFTAQIFQEDFEQERKDREKAHSQVAEIEQRYQHQLQSVVTQLNLTSQDLLKHKQTLATTETLLHSQIEQLSERLSQRDQQVAAIAKGNDRLQEEVLSKTQQVKQYKKQVDQYKEEAKAHKQASEMQIKQVEHFAQEYEEWKSTAAEWKARYDKMEAEVRKERSRSEAFERKIVDLEKLNDQLQQERQRENNHFKQQVLALNGQIQRYSQQLQSQQSHQSDFWEVPRNEITLNMQKFLGTGAWGFVVEGKFRGQQVAVKCLHDLIRQPAVIEVIRKEICIMAQIRHPNLVLLIAAVIDAENDPLIVTELLDISLRKAYENRRLQGSSKLSIFRDVASALNYLHLHQRGEIIHRDVSSANVLLEAKPNNQWKAKLSDFGSAKRAIEAKTTGPGAPAYTAPEVRKDIGIRQTGKLDVYSYGVLLCEVTVEQFPMEGSLPSMVQVVRSRWSFMHRLVTSCMQDHPDNRPTMSYVLGEFDKLRPQK